MYKASLVLRVIAVASLLGCAQQGPSKAVAEIGEAASQHDVSRFERLVDVAGVSEKWGKDMVAALWARGIDLSALERVGVSREYQERSLAEQGAVIIRECVGDGKCGDGGNPWSLAGVFGALAGRDGRVESISTESTEGKLATVAIKIKPSNAEAQFIEAKMRERDGQWQLVELLNQMKLEAAWSAARKAANSGTK